MKYYTIEKSQQIILALLKAHGIRKVVASPGTTNVTLVGSMQNDPWFEMYSSVDERSAAYIATGLAEESGEPVVLTCTGATASRNYLSGLTEAYYRKIPVLAITSNQGREKIGHLVAQNIDRRVLPNDVARLSVSIPVCKDEQDEWNAVVEANRAILELSRHGGGPVHIDVATSYSTDFSVKELPDVRVIRRIMPEDEFPKIDGYGRTVIFVGSHTAMSSRLTESIDRFCATYDAVVLCDHTSGYKGRYRVGFSLVAGQNSYRSELLKVGLLIHIGEMSGDYYTLRVRPSKVWRVSPDGELRDTFRKLTAIFEMDEQTFFSQYAGGGQEHTGLLQKYREECAKVASLVPELPFSNIWIAGKTAPRLPEGSVLHLGILNTLRSWNFFDVPSGVRTYSNVGGFGIDGDISSLAGAALADPNRLFYGALGDLAFFYDLNVLGNRHIPANIRLMMINNGKGTEFRNYGHVCSQWGCEADDYMAAAGHFGDRSSLLVKHYAEDLGYEYLSASSKDEFLQVVDRFTDPQLRDRPMIFEVFTDSESESKALETVLNVVTDTTYMLKKKIINLLK